VVVGGELRDKKWCGSKLPLTTPQSHAYMMTNLSAVHGIPLGIKPHPNPDERSVNEKGVVVGTSTHSIIRRHGGYGPQRQNCQLEVPQWMIFPIGPC
jgi:hypothetical protein